METKDLIANLREWHENLISELCADDVLTCDDLCGYPGPCIVIQAANLLEAQQKRIAELEAALREQEERRWIPVTERLPEPFVSVLIYAPNSAPLPTVHEAYLGHDDIWHLPYVYDVQETDVTHWLPMPEPSFPMKEERR